MESKIKKYMIVASLGVAGGVIYFLPYIKYVFYDAQIAAMNISNQQSGLLLTVYTIGNVLLYIPGGVLADRIAPKKALVCSLWVTSILCFAYAFTFNFYVALLIWLGLSFSTAFVFWASLMKAVRIVGTEEEQGFMYGIYYACNGISGAVIQAIALYVYGTADDIVSGFFRAVAAGGSVIAVAGLLIMLLMQAEQNKGQDTASDFKMSEVGGLLKNPTVWIFSFIIFCGYGVFTSTSYFTPYLTVTLGISPSESGVFTIIRNYLFLLLAPLGGIVADRIFHSTAKYLALAFLILAVCFWGVQALPTGISPLFVSIYTLIPGALAMMLYGVVFSIISEAGISRTLTGTAIGIASIVGYLPDSVYHPLFGDWLDRYGSGPGYDKVFTFLAFSCMAGCLLSLIIYWKNGRARDKRLEAR